MSAIRWEQDVIDGNAVDVWGGWMGRQNVCEVPKFRDGVWSLRRYNVYPGSGGALGMVSGQLFEVGVMSAIESCRQMSDA